MEFKVDDNVYWYLPIRYRGVICISGIIKSIDGDVACIMQTTQNTHGKNVFRKLHTIYKRGE